MGAENHSCLNPRGKLKKCYPTEAQAVKEAKRHDGWMEAYECSKHGWHIGGVVSRYLRDALLEAKRAKERKIKLEVLPRRRKRKPPKKVRYTKKVPDGKSNESMASLV